MLHSLFAAALLALVPSLAFADSPGWITECSYSHTLMDDPIKFPNKRGASHTHDFLGATSAKASSTYESLAAGGTTCGTPADKSGYWVAALKRNGTDIKPDGKFGTKATRQKFYYRDNHYLPGSKVEPFPAGFRMIQGFAMATSVANANANGAGWGNLMWWGCSDNSVSGKPTSPPNCGTGIITLHITFPSCWDGVNVDGDAVATKHVKFPSSKVCPSTHPRQLPMLIERIEWPVGTSGAGIALASGPPYTAHADFFNAWAPAKLAQLVTNCLNADRNCGTNPQ